METKHKEFFEKLARLCEEYEAGIVDSGSVRKGIQVNFTEAVYEKFEASPDLISITDENGDEHLYK